MPGTPEKPGNAQIPEPAPLKLVWTWKKLFLWTLLVLIIHLILLCIFASRSQITPRTVSRVPHLRLAGNSDPLVELGNPTLFALPNPRDFASAVWSRIPAVPAHYYQWSEPPRWLSLETENSGATLSAFAASPVHPQMTPEVKPPASFAVLPVDIGAELPARSSLTIHGTLARRELLSPVTLPSLPYDNVIPPSRVQVVVDQAGHVVSAILLPSTDSTTETLERDDAADQDALEIARQLRFAPARQLDLGEIVFSWQSVPPRLNNSPSGL